MRIGIDSYCYHRYFGEVYGNQKKPPRGMTCADFLKRAAALKVDGVYLETCFFESADESYLKRLREILDKSGLEPVVAWGHPDGLEGGKNPGATEDLKKHFRSCELLGAKVMRIVGSSLAFRKEPRAPQIRRLSRLLKDPARMAGDRGLKLAMENHFDFTADELLQILENVSSENLGITYDTGNALRIGDDPVKAARKLGRSIFATHTKDVLPVYGGDPQDWHYFGCVPVGKGVIDFPALVKTMVGAGYTGLFAVEIDYPHPDYEDEDSAVVESVRYLKKMK
jgi:sugar phosphate isomerase/epimerase